MLVKLFLEFLKCQEWIFQSKKRVLVIMEGRDTTGIGTTLRYLSYPLFPRSYRVIAFRPIPTGKTEWFFQRYIRKLPNPGQIVFFNHSWYTRGIIEPVYNMCTELQFKQFLRDVLYVEEMLKEDGMIIIKIFYTVSRDIQEQRLFVPARKELRKWKAPDWRALKFYDFISDFRDTVFTITSTDNSHWVAIDTSDKHLARKETMRYLLSVLPYKGKESAKVSVEPNPEVVATTNVLARVKAFEKRTPKKYTMTQEEYQKFMKQKEEFEADYKQYRKHRESELLEQNKQKKDSSKRYKAGKSTRKSDQKH